MKMTDNFWKDARISCGGGILALVIVHLTGLVQHNDSLMEGCAVFVGYLTSLGIIHYLRYKRVKS
jgi:hypothetical protein